MEVFACPAVRSVFTIESSDCSKRIAFKTLGKDEFNDKFSVKSGYAIYIGDYEGNSFGMDGGSSVKWEMSKLENNFKETSGILKDRHRNFATLQIVQAFENKKPDK